MQPYRVTFNKVKGAPRQTIVDRFSGYGFTPTTASVASSIHASGKRTHEYPGLWEDIERSKQLASDRTYWVASAVEKYPDMHPETIRPAVARVRREVTGGPLARRAKLLTGIGQTVALELFVAPEHRRQGIGTALAYTALGGFRSNTHTVIDVPLTDEPLAEWATRYGYQPTGERLLVDGMDAVRYGATVGDVLGAMDLAQPWLNQADYESRFDLWGMSQFAGPGA